MCWMPLNRVEPLATHAEPPFQSPQHHAYTKVEPLATFGVCRFCVSFSSSSACARRPSPARTPREQVHLRMSAATFGRLQQQAGGRPPRVPVPRPRWPRTRGPSATHTMTINWRLLHARGGSQALGPQEFRKTKPKNTYFNLNKSGPCFAPGIRAKKRTRPEKTGPYVFSGCVRFRARNVGAVLRPPKSTSERLKRCSLSSPSWWRRCFCCGSCWCWSWWWLWWW